MASTLTCDVTIREADLIESVRDALQHGYFHSPDYVKALGDASGIEESPEAKDAIAQILANSRMCVIGHRWRRILTDRLQSA